MKSGDFGEAINCFGEHLDSKDSIFALTQIAFCYGELEEFEKAINFGERSISSNGTNLNMLLELGNWCFQTQKGDKALNYFLMLERRDSLFQKLNYNIALVYLSEFDAPIASKKYISRELRHYKNDAENYALAGQIELQLDSLDRSIRFLSEAISIANNNPKYYILRAFSYYYSDKDGLALKDLDTTLKLNPNNVDAKLLKLEIGIKYGLPFICSLSRNLNRSGDLTSKYSYLIEKCKKE